MHRRSLIVALLAAGAAHLLAPAPAAAVGPEPPAKVTAGSFAYSDLLSAMRGRQVRRAVLDPARGEATVWLSSGRREKVGIDPRSDLAERLSAAGARVDVRRAAHRWWLPPMVMSLALAGVVGGTHLRVLAGPAKRSSSLSEEEREVVAHHEAGHALVAELCPSQDKTHRLTIRPRGRAAGLAVTAIRDRTLYSTQHVHEQLMVLLGGRAAEGAVYGHVSSGAANDLQQANALARRAVTELGFSPRAGQLVEGLPGRPLRLADTTHRVIDEEVERMIAEAYSSAIRLIEEHRPELDRLARALITSEDLDRLEIAAALGEPRPGRRARPQPGPRPEPALRRDMPAAPHPSAPRRTLRPRLAPVLPEAVFAFIARAGRDRDAPAS